MRHQQKIIRVSRNAVRIPSDPLRVERFAKDNMDLSDGNAMVHVVVRASMEWKVQGIQSESSDVTKYVCFLMMTST